MDSTLMGTEWGTEKSTNLKHSTINNQADPRKVSFTTRSITDLANSPRPEFFKVFTGMENVFQPFRGMIACVVGMPGAGKSKWTMHLACELARRYGHKTAMLSMEMGDHAIHDCLNAYGKAWGCQSKIEECVKVISVDDGINVDNACWMIEKLACDWFIIDPYNQLDQGPQKYLNQVEKQKFELQRLAKTAKNSGRGVIIVTHPTKAVSMEDGKIREPNAYDIDGSAHWFNRMDYIIGITRNTQECYTKVRSLKVRYQGEVQLGAAYFTVGHNHQYQQMVTPK